MVAGFPYAEIEFDKNGAVHDKSQVNSLTAMISDNDINDLLVLSHGWNNDMAQARVLYASLLRSLAGCIARTGDSLPGRNLGVLGILWPSKKFAEKDLIASGAAGLDDGLTAEDLIAQLANLENAFDVSGSEDALGRMAELAPKLHLSGSARKAFVDLATSLFDRGNDPELRSEVPAELFDMDGDEILEALSAPLLLDVRSAHEGATSLESMEGGAALFGGLSGIRAAAQRLLNLITFYQMKSRAATVGQGGVRSILETLRSQFTTLRLHLVGHSFGARLVTAAVRGSDGAQRIEVDSLTLLQAAFSHHGLAKKFDGVEDGYFRQVVSDGRVRGPIVITHTSNDKAVGIAYPIAARLAGQDAAGLGDKFSPFGGMGRNGAQHTPEAVQGVLGGPGTPYELNGGTVHNLLSDKHISDHGDVANEAVAGVLLAAILAT